MCICQVRKAKIAYNFGLSECSRVKAIFPYFYHSVHSRNLKTGATGPLPGKKVGTLQKNVGPQVTTHLIGHVSPLLSLTSLVSGLCDIVNH